MKMIETMKMLWAYSPKETVIYGTITLLCAATMAALLAAVLLPTEPDELEEVSEC